MACSSSPMGNSAHVWSISVRYLDSCIDSMERARGGGKEEDECITIAYGREWCTYTKSSEMHFNLAITVWSFFRPSFVWSPFVSESCDSFWHVYCISSLWPKRNSSVMPMRRPVRTRTCHTLNQPKQRTRARYTLFSPLLLECLWHRPVWALIARSLRFSQSLLLSSWEHVLTRHHHRNALSWVNLTHNSREPSSIREKAKINYFSSRIILVAGRRADRPRW